MILTHPLFLFGLVLVGIPVILHLLMRAKPKKLVFPALRLIQNRKRTNTRRMRLRHVWLLLLRMIVIGLLAFAIARPSVPPADYSLRSGDWLRLCLVAAICAGAYFGLLGFWKKGQTPHHELAYRRSMLRAGLGAAGLLALLLFVAWPYQRRIAAAITQPTVTADEFLPVAAVMLLDTSLSMQYRHENKTRLEVAQDIAAKHMGNMPRLSRVAVCDTAGESPIRFSSDLGGAAKRMTGLSTRSINRPLDDRIMAALEAQAADQESTAQTPESAALAAAGKEGILREIYVFTDLAMSAWREEGSARLREALEQAPGINVYVIDVGILAPTNVAVTELALSDQTLPPGSLLDLRAAVTSTGFDPAERVVELHVENAAGKLAKQGEQTVKIDPASAATAIFSLKVPAGPVVQGEVRLLASDPLAFDDVRYFSTFVHPPSEILVVADARADARYLIDALAPAEAVAQGEARFHCKVIAPGALAGAKLGSYAVVCLVNVADPQPAGWKALEGYLNQGGGVAIFLGDRVKETAYQSASAKAVFPGTLKAQLGFNPPEFLDLKNLTHPILRKFADWGAAVLTSVEIHRYWSVEADQAGVIARYTDHRHLPALVEKSVGKGRVLLLTTAIDRRGWNDLPVSDWGFLALADQMMQYASGSSQSNYNYTAGEEVTLTLDPSQQIPAYLLRKPGLQQLRTEIPPGSTNVAVHEADQLGNYRVVGIETDVQFERGFSVNADPAESRLDRLSKDELDAHLGADRYSIARDIENLQRNVKTGRLGREAFPLVVLILLVVFLGEHFVANRFYDKVESPDAAGPPTQTSPP